MGKANDKKTHRSDSRSNIVGKFTQSVKRIVQEVKEEGVPADGQTRDDAIATNHRLRAVRNRLEEAYETARSALLTLHTQYNHSKTTWNVFARYSLLKAMIKEVVRLETEYWQLLDVPRQDKQEPVLAYVLRACTIVEKSQRSQEQAEKSHRADQEEERKRENSQRLNGMTTSQVLEENTCLTNELFRYLRKYSSLRTLMRELKDDYVESKMYPIVPRYFMLKDMIRDVMRDPAFVEICQEVTQSPPTAAS
ncbi:uncharacterized protein LOC121865989 isoform X2 [Homarus americanus]|uniref:uncharacterized protein LOC121865989 isoform X2 n=1 Tax=Homarus americanus TaxID=6706 RepID=UPI001C44D071|nr:uncharacterized protein LOC121865989 isoform X2 [Homarus americanus]